MPTSLTSESESALTNFDLELLKEEYFFLQTAIEDYNKQIWAIKSLGITGTGSVIALGLKQNLSTFALIGCSIPLFFLDFGKPMETLSAWFLSACCRN